MRSRRATKALPMGVERQHASVTSDPVGRPTANEHEPSIWHKTGFFYNLNER
jgi:hypothetical protein